MCRRLVSVEWLTPRWVRALPIGRGMALAHRVYPSLSTVIRPFYGACLTTTSQSLSSNLLTKDQLYVFLICANIKMPVIEEFDVP